MLHLSTNHLTEDTCENWLNMPGIDVLALKNEGYGWHVKVDDEAPMPEDLYKVMEYAQKHDCEWISFDCDTVVCEDLPTYDWGLYVASRKALNALADLEAGKTDAVPPEVVKRLLREARYHDIAVKKLVADAGI
jgi:hypothetical protein